MSDRLWLGTRGDVTCEDHAGTYLKASIEADPEATHHITPLDWWIVYVTKGMPCETCTPWMSLPADYASVAL